MSPTFHREFLPSFILLVPYVRCRRTHVAPARCSANVRDQPLAKTNTGVPQHLRDAFCSCCFTGTVMGVLQES